jgi:DNA-binding response OmpR family regulator
MCIADHSDERRPEASVRVLIVEDDQTFCAFLVQILESQGHDVVSSTDSLDGYQKAWSHRYDLIVLDVRMPGFLGTEIAAALKQKNPSAKIILISAFADASLREVASNLGIRVLSKPFSPAELFQAIDNTMSEHIEEQTIPSR